MTEEELEELLTASQNGWEIIPDYERAEKLWRRVADRVGCNYDTIRRPPMGSPANQFLAEPK